MLVYVLKEADIKMELDLCEIYWENACEGKREEARRGRRSCQTVMQVWPLWKREGRKTGWIGTVLKVSARLLDVKVAIRGVLHPEKWIWLSIPATLSHCLRQPTGSVADSEGGSWGHRLIMIPTAGDLSSSFPQLPYSHTDLVLQIGSRDNSFKLCMGLCFWRETWKMEVSGENYSHCYCSWSQGCNWHPSSPSFTIHSHFPSPSAIMSYWLVWCYDPNPCSWVVQTLDSHSFLWLTLLHIYTHSYNGAWECWEAPK